MVNDVIVKVVKPGGHAGPSRGHSLSRASALPVACDVWRGLAS
jgi:hypothetical protein